MAVTTTTIQETAEPDYLVTREVAEKFRTSESTVRYWRHIGKGPRSFKVGRRVLYDRRDVEQYAEDLRGQSA